MKIGVLTGGSDKPYVLGLTRALLDKGLALDVVASDELICPELVDQPGVNFMNLRGATGVNAGAATKVLRIVRYYARLLAYAMRREPAVFHILWANRFPLIDHVLVNLFYKAMGKQLVFTAHNVNQRKRDGGDNAWNRFTLGCLYRLVDHIVVHTPAMKAELEADFAVPGDKVDVIPFGINNTLPNTTLDTAAARARLGLADDEKVLLFFGRIAPYKGLDVAVRALRQMVDAGEPVRLLVAGRIESGCSEYWRETESLIETLGLEAHVSRSIDFIPDADVEYYFKAADALVMPYRAIFQSGVVFLGYSFGLPVIASDVGSFRDDVIEGRTGYICRPDDAHDLARATCSFFAGDLYARRDEARREITAHGNASNSWDEVARITCDIYDDLSGSQPARATR